MHMHSLHVSRLLFITSLFPCFTVWFLYTQDSGERRLFGDDEKGEEGGTKELDFKSIKGSSNAGKRKLRVRKRKRGYKKGKALHFGHASSLNITSEGSQAIDHSF